MRPLARLGFGLVLAAAAALVSGCESLENLGSLFDTKTKLPGERKAVFPEGVPGVTPGVPPEMVKGYREPAVEPPSPAAALAEEPRAAEAKPKPKPKPHAIQAAAKPQPAPVAQAAAPPPAPASATAPWPSPQQQQPQPQPQAPWPSAPSSGTISR
jgi:outer membrane biosynthesis protein TonB